MKNIDETRNYFVEEIEQNELMSKKHKKVFTTLNCTKYLLILVSTVTECISIFVFASLVSITIGATSSTTELKICAITAGIKRFKSIIKKKKKNHNKIGLLAKNKLNSIEIWISKPLIDSCISHNEFV